MSLPTSTTLNEIEKFLKNDKKVQIIFAFNGTGKSRLSREFKDEFYPENSDEDDFDNIGNQDDEKKSKLFYYNADYEDLFYWDKEENILRIQPDNFLYTMVADEGQENGINDYFSKLTNDKLQANFNLKENEITFSLSTGDSHAKNDIKISKGETSSFIWSTFYSFLDNLITQLSTEEENRSIHDFDDAEYIFIDDPVSSLDENHLIEIAEDLGSLINNAVGGDNSKTNLKFIVTTHNPLFFNILFNNLGKGNKGKPKYLLSKGENNLFSLKKQAAETPFSYHILLKNELQEAIENQALQKYHFNFFRNLLEKTSSFLGNGGAWSSLLQLRDEKVKARIINISSHSTISTEEAPILTDEDKKNLKDEFENFLTYYHFEDNKSEDVTENEKQPQQTEKEKRPVDKIENESKQIEVLRHNIGSFSDLNSDIQSKADGIIKKYDLEDEATRSFILKSYNKGFVDRNGEEVNGIFKSFSPLKDVDKKIQVISDLKYLIKNKEKV